MSDRKIYANFNQFSVTGRIFNAEIVTLKDGTQFLSASLITNCVKDDQVGTTVSFTNSNGLLSLFRSGKLPVGREVTLTGHISEVSSTYVGTDGKVYDRKRPDIHMVGVTILDGGLGRLPADKAGVTPANAVKQGRVARRPVQTDATPDLAANAAANGDY